MPSALPLGQGLHHCWVVANLIDEKMHIVGPKLDIPSLSRVE